MQIRCNKCGGTLFIDGDEASCLQCGAVHYALRDVPSRETGARTKPRKGYWWSIYEVKHFSKSQLKWLIENLGSLKAGIYPPAPEIIIRYGAETPAVTHREPPREKVLELAAEVESRLELVIDYISGWERPTKAARKKRKRKVLPSLMSPSA